MLNRFKKGDRRRCDTETINLKADLKNTKCMINKIYSNLIFSFLTLGSASAQFIWYENSSSTDNIEFEGAANGTFTTDETNPETSGSPKPDYVPYIRPEGAYLVGEEPPVSAVGSVNQVDFKFYPNPVTHTLTISGTSADVNHIRIISTTGTNVIEKTWENGALLTQLDLSNLNAGIYFITVSNGNNHSITEKIIVFK